MSPTRDEHVRDCINYVQKCTGYSSEACECSTDNSSSSSSLWSTHTDGVKTPPASPQANISEKVGIQWPNVEDVLCNKLYDIFGNDHHSSALCLGTKSSAEVRYREPVTPCALPACAVLARERTILYTDTA
jgi:hypothetical protein